MSQNMFPTLQVQIQVACAGNMFYGFEWPEEAEKEIVWGKHIICTLILVPLVVKTTLMDLSSSTQGLGPLFFLICELR